MRAIRVHYEGGEACETNINGTMRSIRDYYVGKQFNLGDGQGGDRMAIAMHVEFLDKIWYRQDHLNGECTHQEYWGQFVNENVRQLVLQHIGLSALMASKDPHFNDIPMVRWDRLTPFITGHVAKMNVKTEQCTKPAASNVDCICTLKEAAREIVAENNSAKNS